MARPMNTPTNVMRGPRFQVAMLPRQAKALANARATEDRIPLGLWLASAVKSYAQKRQSARINGALRNMEAN